MDPNKQVGLNNQQQVNTPSPQPILLILTKTLQKQRFQFILQLLKNKLEGVMVSLLRKLLKQKYHQFQLLQVKTKE